MRRPAFAIRVLVSLPQLDAYGLPRSYARIPTSASTRATPRSPVTSVSPRAGAIPAIPSHIDGVVFPDSLPGLRLPLLVFGIRFRITEII